VTDEQAVEAGDVSGGLRDRIEGGLPWRPSTELGTGASTGLGDDERQGKKE
jgi:hypothetical protein